MVAETITLENESPIEAKRLWNAMIKDGHNLLPKQAPEIISGVTFVQGDGGVGSIKQINFTSANKDFNYVKERVDEFDESNFVYSFTHVEGGELGKKVASAKFKIKFTPKAGGGSVCLFTCEIDLMAGVPRDEPKIQELNAFNTTLLKKTEAYLLANPGLYC